MRLRRLVRGRGGVRFAAVRWGWEGGTRALAGARRGGGRGRREHGGVEASSWRRRDAKRRGGPAGVAGEAGEAHDCPPCARAVRGGERVGVRTRLARARRARGIALVMEGRCSARAEGGAGGGGGGGHARGERRALGGARGEERC